MHPFDLIGWLQRNRWIWAALAVFTLWIILSAVTSRFSLSNLSGIALSAAFLTIIGLGQMFVVTTGRGNIDLSISSVLTLNAYLALIFIRGLDANILLGVAIAVGVGLLVGGLNSMLVVLLRIPAIIATLATGYILATATLIANRAIPGFVVSPLLRYVASARLEGVPIMVIVALGGVVIAGYVLRHTAYGFKLSAVGQNREAARLTGIKVGLIISSTFILSSLLASLTGMLLGAYVGGAFLEMGQPYLLQSVAAVVLGGTLILGGYATALGTFFASILLILIVTTMQVIGLPPGTQDMVQGAVVILILALAGREAGYHRATKVKAEWKSGAEQP